MKVNVKYFAALREATGLSEEVIETNGQTVSSLFSHLKEKHDLKFKESHLKVAVNEEYVDFSKNLSEQDTVVFLPPVAGG